MVKVTFVSNNGTRREVQVAEGETAREAALFNDVPGIDGDCGGACACATCHVYVEGGWMEKLPPMNDLERDMLDFAFDVRENSRLACQIKVSPKTEGLVIRTPARQY